MASQARHIDDPPAAGQLVDHDGKRYTTIQEGGAYILVPQNAKDAADQKDPRNKGGPVQSVFYNPIQQFNRDLTVLAIKAYGEERMEKKKAILEEKRELVAIKKRKRLEAKKASRPNKAAKSDDTTTAGAAVRDTKQAAQAAVEGGAQEAEPSMPQAANSNGSDARQGSDIPTEATSVEGQSEQAAEAANGQDVQRSAKEYTPSFSILDALSATGLRALRYAQEMPFVTKITANDLDASAVQSIKLNVLHNKLDGKIQVNHGDAIVHMYSKIAAQYALTEKQKALGKCEKYDVVDLDPYGTAATFLDAAVQAVRDDGGLLCVTCTDAGVWASNGYPEKAFALYGGVPVKGFHSHEVGLRLILHAIATSASRYGLAIEPLLSLSIDFYARVFVRVSKSPAAVKFSAGKAMILYNCDAGCGAWTTQFLLRNKSQTNKNGSGTFYKHTFAQGPTADQHCEHCGVKMHLGGPMYGGRLHSPDFIRRILDKLPKADKSVYGTTERVKGMLTTALEEHLEDPASDAEGAPRKSKDDALAEIEPYPFFFVPTALARTVHCATPPEDAMRGALRGLGYRVTRSHCKPGSVKTDAPWGVIWHVMREWIRQKAPVKEANIKPGSPGYRILGLDAKEEPAAVGGDQAAPDGEKKEEGAEEKKPEVIFDEKLGRDPDKRKLVRYQTNPRENWGPMNRAKGQ